VDYVMTLREELYAIGGALAAYVLAVLVFAL
jgi:hypothetical protein